MLPLVVLWFVFKQNIAQNIKLSIFICLLKKIKKIANLRKLSDTIKGMYPSTRFSSYEDETNRIGKFKIVLLLKPTTIQKK